MLLTRDVLRLLVRNHPKSANSLLRTSKKTYDWITTDYALMRYLGEYYHKKLSNDLSLQVRRLFHFSDTEGSVKDVYISEPFVNKKRCIIAFNPHGFTVKRNKDLSEIKIEVQNPQSKNALVKIEKLGRKAEILRRQQLVDDEESFQQIDDIVKGVMHAVNEALQNKGNRKWDWLECSQLFFVMMCVVVFTLTCYTKNVPIVLELLGIMVITIVYYRKSLGCETLLF